MEALKLKIKTRQLIHKKHVIYHNLRDLLKKLPLKVTKTIEEAMTINENKYKNILNHQGNVKHIDSDSLVLNFSL
jgi:hypothetical protein